MSKPTNGIGSEGPRPLLQALHRLPPRLLYLDREGRDLPSKHGLDAPYEGPQDPSGPRCEPCDHAKDLHDSVAGDGRRGDDYEF